MFDQVAVRAKHAALFDFALHGRFAQAAVYHVSYVKLFSVWLFVMKLKRAPVGEATTFAGQSRFVIVQPLAEPTTSHVGDRSLTLLTSPPSVRFAFYDAAYFKHFFRLILTTVGYSPECVDLIRFLSQCF